MARHLAGILEVMILLTHLTTTLAAALPPCEPPLQNTTCEALTIPSGDPTTLYISTTFQTTSYLSSPANGNAAAPANPINTTACPSSLCDPSSAIISGKSTNPSAPQTADCTLLETWATSSSGHWILATSEGKEWIPLIVTGSCALVARAEVPFVIGTEDVAELMRTSIRDYGMGDRVEVLGSMPCAGAGRCAAGGRDDGGSVGMEWWIVRPDMVSDA